MSSRSRGTTRLSTASQNINQNLPGQDAAKHVKDYHGDGALCPADKGLAGQRERRRTGRGEEKHPLSYSNWGSAGPRSPADAYLHAACDTCGISAAGIARVCVSSAPTSITMKTADNVITVLYVAACLGLGLFAGTKHKPTDSARDFFLGGRWLLLLAAAPSA